MTSQGEHIIRAISNMRNTIKKKLKHLKSGSVQTQRKSEARYKPLIEPLKDFTQNVIRKHVQEHVGPSKKIDVATQEVQTSPETTPPTTPVLEDPPKQFVVRVPSPTPLDLESYIQVNGIEDELGSYLRFVQSDKNNEADFTYGVHYDGSNWKMGNSTVRFTGNNIIVDDVRYEGTPGLFELVFKKRPIDIYNEKDLEKYKHLLMRTNVHKQDDGVRIKANRGYKYTNIISDLFPSKKRRQSKIYARDVYRTIPPVRHAYTPVDLRDRRKRTTERPLSPYDTHKKAIGEGLLMRLDETKIDYRYWDDPNELVDRLRLLIASKDAGNTGHENEIIAILEELKEAGIIKDYSNFRM